MLLLPSQILSSAAFVRTHPQLPLFNSVRVSLFRGGDLEMQVAEKDEEIRRLASSFVEMWAFSDGVPYLHILLVLSCTLPYFTLVTLLLGSR